MLFLLLFAASVVADLFFSSFGCCFWPSSYCCFNLLLLFLLLSCSFSSSLPSSIHLYVFAAQFLRNFLTNKSFATERGILVCTITKASGMRKVWITTFRVTMIVWIIEQWHLLNSKWGSRKMQQLLNFRLFATKFSMVQCIDHYRTEWSRKDASCYFQN